MESATSLKPYKLAHPSLTFGDSVAWLPKKKILFNGDRCVNWGTIGGMKDLRGQHAYLATPSAHRIRPMCPRSRLFTGG